MARNYHHHPFRERVKQNVLPPSLPARRDLVASHVYIQTWEHKAGGTLKGFLVLALDASDADIQGGIRLASQGNDARDWRCVQNHEVAEPSLDLITAALNAEDVEELEHREASYRRREEPREPSLNDVSFDEQMDSAYRAMQERRR